MICLEYFSKSLYDLSWRGLSPLDSAHVVRECQACQVTEIQWNYEPNDSHLVHLKLNHSHFVLGIGLIQSMFKAYMTPYEFTNLVNVHGVAGRHGVIRRGGDYQPASILDPSTIPTLLYLPAQNFTNQAPEQVNWQAEGF